MRRPDDPKDPEENDARQPTPGGRARERLDLFNRQRGIPTDSDVPGKKPDPDTGEKTPKSKRTED